MRASRPSISSTLRLSGSYFPADGASTGRPRCALDARVVCGRKVEGKREVRSDPRLPCVAGTRSRDHAVPNRDAVCQSEKGEGPSGVVLRPGQDRKACIIASAARNLHRAAQKERRNDFYAGAEPGMLVAELDAAEHGRGWKTQVKTIDRRAGTAGADSTSVHDAAGSTTRDLGEGGRARKRAESQGPVDR